MLVTLLAEGVLLNVMESLRTRLRESTRAAHDRVDTFYRACDIASAADLDMFLSDHLRAFDAISIVNGSGVDDAEALLKQYRAAIETDLATLGGLPLRTGPRLWVSATAVLYVLLGSRRGAQMLHRHWTAHAQGDARLAGAFLSLPPRNQEWQQLCLDLTAQPPYGPVAEQMVADVNAIFGLFGHGPDLVSKDRDD